MVRHSPGTFWSDSVKWDACKPESRGASFLLDGMSASIMNVLLLGKAVSVFQANFLTSRR